MTQINSTITPAVTYVPTIIQEQTIPVKYIYQISDIHIHLYKRHNEYSEVFDNVINYLTVEKAKYEPDNKSNRNTALLCIITGDVLHSKSDLSPECVALTYKFIKDISEVIPVVIIPGNHDLNMNNKNRLDSLTPIICDLPEYNPVYYLNATGVWQYGNLTLAHASIFDYIIPRLEQIQPIDQITSSPNLNIILFHGRIDGVLLFNGTNVQGEENGLNKKVITLSDFKDYDMGLFGDIHKHQWLDEAKSRAYAGSLIQQHHGEDLEQHGLIKWDIATRNGEFVNMPNNYGYVTINIADGVNDYLIPDGTVLKPVRTLPKNLHVRILYSGTTTQVQITAFISQLKTFHNVLDFSSQSAATRVVSNRNTNGNLDASNTNLTISSSSTNISETNSTNELNINNIDYQNRLIEEIIKEQYEDVPDEHIEIIKNLNKEANRVLVANNTEQDITAPRTGSTKYKMVKLEFDNLFSYGPGNSIDFTQFRGVVGIVAPNHTGKSAILDIILWTLFDKFPRKGSTKDIINNRKDSYRAYLELDVGVWRYGIEKSGKRLKDGVAPKTKCVFTRRNMITGQIESLEKDNGKQTKQVIADVFGSYEDMINTNFSIQTNSTGFIDAENTARRKELERILRFDFLTELAKNANDGFRAKKSVFEHLQKNMPPELITKMVDNITKGESRIIELEGNRTKFIYRVSELQNLINDLNRRINPEIEKQLESVISDYDLDTLDLSHGSNLDESLKNHIIFLEKQRDDCEKKINTLSGEIKECADELHISTSVIDGKTINNAHIKEELIRIKSEFQANRQTIKLELDTLSKAIQKRTGEKRALRNTVHAKKESDWFESVITTTITIRDEHIAKLSDLSKYDTLITTLEEKNVGYRLKIDEKRVENEQLLKAESVPQNMIALLNNGDALPQLRKSLYEMSGKLYGKPCSPTYPEFIELLSAYKMLGWLEGIDTMAKRADKTLEKIDKNTQRIADYVDRIKKYEQDIQVAKKELAQRHILEKQIADNNSYIDTLKHDKDVVAWNKDIDTLIAELLAKKAILDKQYMSTDTLDTCEYLSGLLLKYSEQEVIRKDVRTKLANIHSIGTNLEDLMIKAEENNKFQEQIIANMRDMDSLNKQLGQVNGELEVTKDTVAGYRAQLEKMRSDCNTKIEVEKMMNMYAVYRDVMKQIPFRLISRVKDVLERKVNDLLAMVTNFSVKFDITDSNIDIYLDRAVYEGRPILINNSSGFERFISSLAIRIALMEISQLPSPNFMAIDEGWSCFDNENINNIDVILDHLMIKFDYILTISHLQVIRQHCDIQVNLRRDDDGFSHVNYG
jgi:DNA repair exonuclease SbcCD ATPase subunit/DNA repair exonuclease SbcCD nuclease subunit